MKFIVGFKPFDRKDNQYKKPILMEAEGTTISNVLNGLANALRDKYDDGQLMFILDEDWNDYEEDLGEWIDKVIINNKQNTKK